MEFMTSQHDGSGIVLTFRGRLDTIASQELKLPIRAELDRQPTNLTCNFQDVTYIGSAVLRLIFEAARELQRRNGIFRVTHCPAEIRRVFSLTGMDHIVVGGEGPKFTHETKDGTLRIYLHGRMDALRVGEIRSSVRELVSAHRGPIRFDIAAVPYAASAFVHLCIDASKSAKANTSNFGLEKVVPDTAHIFRLAGLQSLILSSV
jgi:anti-anti-sigma factor